jgi:ATP-dependent Lon protease
LGSSIAKATGRPFVRVSLGGVRDEATLRGHRKTYVGAVPGRIIDAIRKAGVRNPVVLLDEVDKLSEGVMGSPESALLEVLDPEQNATFVDHYLDVEFDLSEVTFICTANDIGRISGPLRSRLEMINVEGYTPIEKRNIARRHLIEQQMAEHALPVDSVEISDEAIDAMIEGYTREAGVRQLKRSIAKMCRGLALEVARHLDDHELPVQVDVAGLEKYLGKQRFFRDAAERAAVPGISTGLAWTAVGGDILFIETTQMRGKGQLQITGQLGDVMQESVRTAVSYVRSHSDELKVSADFLDKHDLHVHVPAGATPKDGPSAGITIFSALISLLTNRPIRSDTAMTGEVTLSGRVLPVGGIKAKVLAAHRAGIRRVLVPKRNERDLEEVPEEVREEMEFFPVENVHEVLELIFDSNDPASETGPQSHSVVKGQSLDEPNVPGYSARNS